MHLDIEGSPAQAESGMVIKRHRIGKVLVIDPDTERCARIAGALPTEHVIFVAHETTLALALCIRERPSVVVAHVHLGTMTLAHFISLVDYTGVQIASRWVAIGTEASVDRRVVPIASDRDVETLYQTVTDLMRQRPSE